MSWLKKVLGTTDAVADARERAAEKTSPEASTGHQLAPGWTSPEVTQTENEVILKMNAPGLDPNSVRTEVDGTALIVKARGSSESGSKINLNERLAFQGGADLSQADVSYDDGKLVVRLPKSAFPSSA